MSWKEFIVYTSNEAEESVANLLNNHGANGVVIENIKDVERVQTRYAHEEMLDVDVDRYSEKHVLIKAYFYKDDNWDRKEIQLKKEVRGLRAYDIPLGSLYFDINTVEEADWENEWKRYFHVEQVTDRMTIVPIWEEYEKVKDELLIYIDPGMAFGTGTHPTTILSLKALERYIKEGDDILDVGAGSGILSIGACLLGARHVYGFDLDPVAVKSTTLNRNLNNLQSRITAEKSNLLQGNTIRANIVVSNILAEIIVDLVTDAYEALYEGGYFITSGIIQDKQTLVEDRLRSVGFHIIDIKQMEQWVSIIAQKKET